MACEADRRSGEQMAPSPRVAVVLGAGGSAGHAYHSGVLTALQDVLGFDAGRADRLLGTSAGSIVATLLAGGVPAADLGASALDRERSPAGRERVARIPSTRAQGGVHEDQPSLLDLVRPASPGLLARLAVRPRRVRPGVLVAAALPEGRIHHGYVAGHVPALLGTTWPEQVWIPAVRLADGARVVFGRDGDPPADLVDAVTASCAIPGWFRPVTVDGATYVDGGVHSPTNLDVLAGQGFDLVVVSSPMSVAPDRRWSPDLPARLAWARMLARERRVVEDTGTPVVTFQPTADDQRAMGLRMMDPSRREQVVRQAHASVCQRLQQPDVQERLEPLAAVTS